MFSRLKILCSRTHKKKEEKREMRFIPGSSRPGFVSLILLWPVWTRNGASRSHFFRNLYLREWMYCGLACDHTSVHSQSVLWGKRSDSYIQDQPVGCRFAVESFESWMSRCAFAVPLFGHQHTRKQRTLMPNYRERPHFSVLSLSFSSLGLTLSHRGSGQWSGSKT